MKRISWIVCSVSGLAIAASLWAARARAQQDVLPALTAAATSKFSLQAGTFTAAIELSSAETLNAIPVATGYANGVLAKATPTIKVPVPNVVGLTESAAASAIAAADLTLGAVTQAFSATVAAGDVISEKPAAGTSVATGTAVNLVVSSSFTALAATMTSIRFFDTATLLPNGQVLIAGGLTAFGRTAPALNTAELYDPTANEFTAVTAKMKSPRDQFTATLLPDGLVLIAGGSNNLNGNGMKTSELYNPNTKTFKASAAMTTPRGGHTATLLPTGKVLITGGFDDGPALSTAELYDPVANTFTALTAMMTTARSNHTATLLPTGQVLLTGGKNGSAILNTAELYDPVAGTFKTVTDTMTAARVGHEAALLPDGQVLLTGGVETGFSTTSLTALDTAEVFNPNTETFAAIPATLSTARAFHTATLLSNGLVLITGGATGSGGAPAALNTAEVFEALPPSVQKFTALTGKMTTARSFHTGTMLPDGLVLMAGGCGTDCTGGSGTGFNTAELYNPTANTFTALTATMTVARFGHTATLLPNGQVLIAGAASGTLGTAELYNPTVSTFTALTAALTMNRRNHAAALLPTGKVLLTGGYVGSGGPVNTAELFDPVAQTFTAITATMTSIRANHTATLLPNGRVLIAGGTSGSGSGPLNSAEIYDPVENTFTVLTAPMTEGRAAHAAALLPSGQILLTGGETTSSDAIINTAELYDPVAQTFTAINARMPSIRAAHTGTLLPSGQVLIAGGFTTLTGPALKSTAVYAP